MDRTRRIDNHIFDGLAFFEGCDRRRLADLVFHAGRIRVRPGTVLAEAGRTARELIVVVEGTVQTQRGPVTLVHGPGLAVAPDAVARRARFPLTVTAVGEVEVLVVNGPAFGWAVRDMPELAHRAASPAPLVGALAA